MLRRWVALAAFLVVAGWLPLQPAESPSGRYAVILQDQPVATFAAGLSPQGVRGSAAVDYQARVLAAQTSLRSQIESRGLRVTGAVQTLLNAVFVEASEAEAAQIRTMPGVSGVVPVKRFRLKLNRALPLMNVPAAWTKLGGVGNAGAGVKIAIIDSGIDQTHPAFQNTLLSTPTGYPRCDGRDCDYTNNKVIAARSYIAQLGAGAPGNPAAESRPDDVSPRDHIGHGTALAMIAAGQTNSGPGATITGVAPQAWLGSYKVFGSPGVNDYTSGDVIIKALEDALNDGMDIASLSIGSPAVYGPLDTGATCGQNPGVPCDAEAMAVENAVKAGMLVVVAAGNEGDIGFQLPTLGTIGSPADAPSAIAVGASTNSHTFTESLRTLGSAVPANLQLINALFGDGPIPSTLLTARLIDVTTLGNNGLACGSSLPANSLTGSIALIQRGTCTFAVKALNALNAGAVGVVFYQSAGLDDPIVPSGLSSISIPTVMIGYTNGVALKSYLAANPGTQVSLDPTLAEQLVSTFNTIASFSSLGPVIGGASMKPDMVAVGTDIYMAAQTFDPNGFLYDPSRYSFASGTSFATPMVAGAAALVLQANPGFTPAQLKSALANTATQDVTDGGVTAGANSVGAGKVDAGAAVGSTLMVTPATVYFGALTAGQRNLSQALTLTNTGTSAVSLSFSVMARAGNPIALDKNSLALNPGQSGTVNAILSGSVSKTGFSDGGITIQGTGQALRVPYGYVVGDGLPADIISMAGDCFEGPAGGAMTTGPLGFELVDQFGVPVAGRTVQFGVTSGGGSIQNPDARTDSYGIAFADATLGSSAGSQSFFAQAGGQSLTFSGDARVRPALFANGAVNAASFTAGGASPGSYIALFGTGLSDLTVSSSGPNLMPSLMGGDEVCGAAGVSVSFDVPSAGLSFPGYMIYVSPNQVNVLLPWELSGQSSAQMKVSIGTVSGVVYTLPLAQFSPGVFEYVDQGTNQLLAIGLDDTGMLIGSASAALRGHVVRLYLNGLGPVDQQPASGQPAASSPRVNTLAQPTLTIGGKAATVQFSGLSPLAPALYEIDFVVPSDAPSGVQPLAVSIGGVPAAVSKMPVQ